MYLLSTRQLKIVTLLGQGTTFAVSVGCPRKKANTEQRGPLLGIGKCISSQLYKGQAGRAAPS
jgi:hypothetical protein